MKFNPIAIIKAHRSTYRDATTGRRMLTDYLAFEGVPAVVVAVTFFLHAKVSESLAIAVITAAALVGALLFGSLLQMSQRALDWADRRPLPGPETSRQAIYARELAANAGYASLVCLATSAAYVVAIQVKDNPQQLALASALSLGLTLHLALIVLMILKRVFSMTEERLLEIRTGGNLPSQPGQPTVTPPAAARRRALSGKRMTRRPKR